jgi:hypothetical protein
MGLGKAIAGLRAKRGAKPLGYSKAAGQKIGSVMREGMAGKLHSGKGGPIVKNPKQMKAIALSEARSRGLRVPSRSRSQENFLIKSQRGVAGPQRIKMLEEKLGRKKF